tara:strand:+ start:29 stop:319 length:291 start_codon:yes stop_codon:yes gene_type:complete
MRNQHLESIKTISELLKHRAKKIDESIEHEDINYYSNKIASLVKQLNRAMLTQSDLNLLLEIVKGANLPWETAQALPTKLRTLRNISVMTNYERRK